MSDDQARRDALADALTGVFSLRCWCDLDPRRDACPKHGSADALMPLLADWAAEERRAGAEGVRAAVKGVCEHWEKAASLYLGRAEFGPRVAREVTADVRDAIQGDK